MPTEGSEREHTETELELLNAAEVHFEKAQKAFEEAREAAIDILTLCQGVLSDRIHACLACGLIDDATSKVRLCIGRAQAEEKEAEKLLEYAGGETSADTERPQAPPHQSEGWAEPDGTEAETQAN